MVEFRKRAVACMEIRWEGEGKDKGEDIVVTEIHTEGREWERERRREVVGGNGPYREAGTTLASAILSAKDIHNHLVPLALSRGTRVVVTRRPLHGVALRRVARRFFPYPKKERGDRPEKDLSMSSPLLPFFARLVLFFSLSSRTPLTSYYFARFPLTLGRTSGISHAYSKRAHRRRNEVPFILRGRDRARNKGRRLRFLPRFTSLRPGALCRSALLY